MATRFITKALSTAALGIALSISVAATTTASPASSIPSGALQLDPSENPFAGSWSGTYLSQTEPPLYGTINLTADAAPSVITFFVDSAWGSDDGAGTEADPFRTIGAAVEAARNVGSPVCIDVRAGTYAGETFPIVVDFDDCTIRAVPSSPGSGRKVRIVAAPPLGPGNTMLAIAAAAAVKLEGLWFDAGGALGFPNSPNYGSDPGTWVTLVSGHMGDTRA